MGHFFCVKVNGPFHWCDCWTHRPPGLQNREGENAALKKKFVPPFRWVDELLLERLRPLFKLGNCPVEKRLENGLSACIRQVVSTLAPRTETDQELLQRFVGQRDEAAFTA